MVLLPKILLPKKSAQKVNSDDDFSRQMALLTGHFLVLSSGSFIDVCWRFHDVESITRMTRVRLSSWKNVKSFCDDGSADRWRWMQRREAGCWEERRKECLSVMMEPSSSVGGLRAVAGVPCPSGGLHLVLGPSNERWSRPARRQKWNKSPPISFSPPHKKKKKKKNYRRRMFQL